MHDSAVTASCRLIGQPKIIGSFAANQGVAVEEQAIAKVKCRAFTVA